MSALTPYADAEAVVRQRIIDLLDLAPEQVGTAMPADNRARPRQTYVRVEELPSALMAELTYVASVDIDVWAATVADAKQLTSVLATSFLTESAVVEVDGRRVVLERSTMSRSPAKVPDDDVALARRGMTVEPRFRR